MTVLAGTDDGLVVGSGHDLVGHVVSHVAAGTGGQWWAIADGALWRGVPGGGWDEVGRPPQGRATCVVQHGAEVLVGVTGAHVARLAADGLEIVSGFEDAEGRDDWYTPWRGPPDTRSLATTHDGVLFANVHVGGVLRSRDGGATWSPTLDIDDDVHQVTTFHGAVLVAAGTAAFEVSRDDGATWATADAGLHGTYCRAVAGAGEHVLVSASTGPFTDRAAVYRRRLDDDGAPFEQCRVGDDGWFGDNIDTFCLAAEGDTVALGSDDGRLFASDDAGATWSLVAADLPRVRCVALS